MSVESSKNEGGLEAILSAIAKSHERVLKDGEQPLNKRSLIIVREEVQKRLKWGKTLDEAIEGAFSTDRWGKQGVTKDKLVRYEEFARDYFKTEEEESKFTRPKMTDPMPTKQGDFFTSQEEQG